MGIVVNFIQHCYHCVTLDGQQSMADHRRNQPVMLSPPSTAQGSPKSLTPEALRTLIQFFLSTTGWTTVMELGDNFTDSINLPSTTVTSACNTIEFGEKNAK